MSSSPIHPNPGYLYQLSRAAQQTPDEIAMGLSPRAENLHVYLIPPTHFVATEPLKNERLNSLIEDAEVIVFESPLEPKKENPIDFTAETLIAHYDEPALRRIAASLSVEGEDKQSLAKAISTKLFHSLSQNETPEPPTTPESTKEQLFNQAQRLGKAIAYIDERDTLGRYAKTLFEDGLLELFLTAVFPDLELMSSFRAINQRDMDAWNAGELPEDASEPMPVALSRVQELYCSEIYPNEAAELAQKIDHFLSTHKNSLLILEDSPAELQDKLRLFQAFNYGTNELNIKGPLEEPKGLFWKIKKEGATVGYLLGSLHLTPKHLHALNSRIRHCFERSECLALEINPHSEPVQKNVLHEKRNRWVEKCAHWPEERFQSVIDMLRALFPEIPLSEDRLTYISEGLAHINAEINRIAAIKPGIDIALLQKAQSRKIPVEGLETVEEYAQQGPSPEAKGQTSDDELLIQALCEINRASPENNGARLLIDQMAQRYLAGLRPRFEAWEQGDVEAFDHTQMTSPHSMAIMRERNRNMAHKIATLVQSERRLFCCIGASHVAGEGSVQSFLNDLGLTSERV